MRLIEFLNTVERDLLHEAARDRYMQMVTSFPVPEVRSHLEKELDWAMQNLKREDRIIWYMRWAKLGVMRRFAEILIRSNTIDSLGDETAIQRFNQTRDKIANQLSTKHKLPKNQVMGEADYLVSNRTKEILKHLFSLGLPGIERVVFQYQNPDNIISELSRIENEWAEKRRGMLPDNQEGAEKIISFPDGSAWFLLDRGYCPDEAKAMGHCGNAGAHDGDRILSYRTPKKVDNEMMWEPHLTFILHHDGKLGETKGKANNKPSAKYHEVIMELLKQPFIKGIRGGGYKPENNFKLTDLTQEQQDEIVTLKPDLATYQYRIKKFGLTPELVQKMDKESPSTEGWNQEHNAFVLEYMEDLADVADEIEIRGGAKQVNNLKGLVEYSFDYFDTTHIDDSMMEDLLDAVEKKYPGTVNVMRQYMVNVYPQAVAEELGMDESDYNSLEEFNAELRTDLNSLSTRDISRILDNEDDEMADYIKHAISDGERYGAEADFHDDLRKYMEEPTNQQNEAMPAVYFAQLKQPYKGQRWYSTKDGNREQRETHYYYALLAYPDTIAKELDGEYEDLTDDDIQDILEFDEFQQPYYGWQGYDEDGAIEAFVEGDAGGLLDQWKQEYMKQETPDEAQ